MSFYKPLKNIIKEIIQIHSGFLWHGNKDKRRINWIKWRNVCKPKEGGGLGVRNIKCFNNALICKWKWRILQEGDVIWRDILTFRYGNLQNHIFCGTCHTGCMKTSIWWKDIQQIDRNSQAEEDWFAYNISNRVGPGNMILFWKFVWLGIFTLKLTFPSLFQESTNPDSLVKDLGV